MYNVFDQISAARKPMSEQQALKALDKGDPNKALALLSRGHNNKEIIRSLSHRLAKEQPEPLSALQRFHLIPFSEHFVADASTGVIHYSQQELVGGLAIAPIKTFCGTKLSGTVRVLQGRFDHPSYHQSRCPQCENSETLILAEGEADPADDGWFSFLNSRIEQTIGRRVADRQPVSIDKIISDAMEGAETEYQALELAEKGGQAIEVAIGPADYQYFTDAFGYPPEEQISLDEWRQIVESSSGSLNFEIAIMRLLIDKSNA